MSAMQIKIFPAGMQTDRVERGLASFLLVGTVLFVLFCGAFPFDFSFPPSGMIGAIQRHFSTIWFEYDPGNVDRSENIFFFIPFGFALAANIRIRRFGYLWQPALALPASAILSTFVECSQTFVSFRDPSLQDVWCNTLGGVLGAIVFAFIGRNVLRQFAQGLIRLRPLARPDILGAALALYGVLQLSAPLMIRPPGDLSVWDVGLPLSLGNETTGMRAWEGTVWDIALSNQAATAEQAMQLSKGEDPRNVLGSSLLAYYRPRGRGPEYPDLTGQLKPLKWMENQPDESVTKDSPPKFTLDCWLSTVVAIAPAIYRIGQSSELTVALTAATSQPDQHGLARIADIAAGPRGMNLMIGQEFSDLTIRLRSAMRTAPFLQLRGLFQDTTPKHIVVTHKNARITVYIDGIEQGRVEITPEAKVIWRLYPRGGFRMRIDTYGYRSYAAIYRLLVFIPFAALLGAMLATSNWSIRTKRLVAGGVMVGFVLILELILGTQYTAGFQFRNLLISLVIGFGTLGAMMIRRKPRTRRVLR